MSDRLNDIERLYALIEKMRERCGGGRTLSTCDSRSRWPERGVYFFFEPGEFRSDGVTPRVVHVGTHGLRPSRSTLWARLSQHKGSAGGAIPGGGNHRGSVFRSHIGAALLATGVWCDQIHTTWGQGSSASKAIRLIEQPLERAVSEYIGSMPVVWVEVDDEPSTSSDRGLIKRNVVALLSNFDKATIDPPSAGWLGASAEHVEIRRSGLWNVNHVDEICSPSFLDVLERRVG